MATISEDYVSFETAKLLKEKGFNEKCRTYYKVFPENRIAAIYHSSENRGVSEDDPNEILCPTLQMAMKWLREVHDCSIEIISNGYLMDNDATWECDIKFGHQLYLRHIQCEKTYEDCAEAAIKYCLENLI